MAEIVRNYSAKHSWWVFGSRCEFVLIIPALKLRSNGINESLLRFDDPKWELYTDENDIMIYSYNQKELIEVKKKTESRHKTPVQKHTYSMHYSIHERPLNFLWFISERWTTDNSTALLFRNLTSTSGTCGVLAVNFNGEKVEIWRCGPYSWRPSEPVRVKLDSDCDNPIWTCTRTL